MRPYYFTEGSSTNFGDDINRWLWARLLPEMTWEDDGTLFCGIGTILGRGLPLAERYIVFSSGVGYGPPTEGFGGPNWDVICVRGPLTARALGLPSAAGVADGSLLLGSLPDFQPLPESERSGVVFMPHYDVLDAGDWPEICRLAGVKFINPHTPSEAVLEQLRSAKLVLADAMHAAIVADVLRVPWVPVTTSRRSNTFKWLDWTLSLGLPYRPLSLPSPTLLEGFRNQALGLYGHRYSFTEMTPEAAISDFMGSRVLKEHLLWEPYARVARRMTYFAPARVLGAPVFSAVLRSDTSRRAEACAEALRSAARSTSYLSDENRFYSKVEQLQEKLEEVKQIARR
jgi:succinoglycan biosynthesis protein ExoV